MTWIKITNSQNKQVPKNTIGKLLKQTTNYYFIQHWHLNKTIQELKSNCEIFDSQIGQIVNYSDYTRNIICMRFKVVDYTEDMDTGRGSYSQMTGLRCILEPINKELAYNNNIEQKVKALVAELDNCG